MQTLEVAFAGKLLLKDGGHLIECAMDPGVVALHAYKLDGSFLVRIPDTGAWLFVAGIPAGSRTVRHALLDDGPDRDRAARDLHAIGVRILPAEQAQAEFEADTVPLYNVTLMERAPADAAACCDPPDAFRPLTRKPPDVGT
ncbi:hypothetical protein [Azospirillum sp.]|uniref:hypothetical protein n=1 Tax=Azospirillum sp. TaxID=34012 RepID=UPI002D78435B|nr:hypothetical protein [Azospirillum sp.]